LELLNPAKLKETRRLVEWCICIVPLEPSFKDRALLLWVRVTSLVHNQLGRVFEDDS